MSFSPHPRRSVLYVPGSNSRAIEKSAGLASDVIVFDLEDVVAPKNKTAARARIHEALQTHTYAPKEVIVRVNARDTPWHHDDLLSAVNAGADGVLVPKVESPDEIQQIAVALDRYGAPQTFQIWAMIETPKAVLATADIAAASDRLSVLVVGTNDLIAEMGSHHAITRAALTTALSLVVLGARAAGRVVLDGVYNKVRDVEGLTAEALQARELGFDGKTLVHPDQIDPVNEIFQPSEADLSQARELIHAFDTQHHDGVTVVDGQMVELLHVHNAQRTLAMHEKITALARAH